MRSPVRKPTAAAVLLLASVIGVQAQTLRNPVGSGAPPLGGPTRNATGASSTPASGSAASRSDIIPDQATRPAPGANPAQSALSVEPSNTTPGHALGVGPNGTGQTGTGLGGGSPSVVNPSGANAGAGPAPLGAARPNGGSPSSGAKAAPLQANGVHKVQ